MSAERVIAGSAGERFELLGPLGRGAMGQVWRAREQASGREVALKLLLRCDELTRARFAREGELMARLDHPGIVRVYSSGSVEGKPYLACELIEGARTLDDLLEEAPLAQRLTWLEEAGDALGAAHALGIVHRDVKLENLLVDAGGSLRLTDFGVATALDLEQLTRTGRAVGTPYTMAPEQVRGAREEISPATDVWALGVLLYLALADELPFTSPNAIQLAAEILTANPPPLRQAPPALAELCRRALSPEPTKRPGDGDAFAAALRAARLGPRRSSRAWIPALGAGLLTALAFGAGLWAASAPADPRPDAAELLQEASPDPSASASSPTPPSASAWEQARAAAARGDWRAFELAEQAARGGEHAAMVWLGEHLPERAGFLELQLVQLEAAQWLARAAEAGDAEAQVRLAKRLEDGRWLPHDRTRATAYYRRAAKQGHPLGMLGYGIALTSSAGGTVERDVEAGEALLEQAAATGNPEALAWWGMRRFYHHGQREEGRALLLRAARAGSAFAWVQLARTHSGTVGGTSRNPQRQVECLRGAALLGDLEGIYQLGRVLLSRGEISEAVPLLELARGRGNERATTDLAIFLLRSGRQAAALELLRQRAAAEDGLACRVLALALLASEPAPGSPAFKEAFELAQRAAPADRKASFVLGALWEKAGDVDTARSHYERAAQRGLPGGCLAMWRLELDAGRDEAAWTWLVKAADLGLRAALIEIGKRLPPERLQELARAERLHALYLAGQLFFSRSEPQLWERGVDTLRKAAGLGHAPAQVALARALLCGHGVERNTALARAWLEAATTHEDPEAYYELARLAFREGRGVDANYLLQRAHGLGSARARDAYASNAARVQLGVPAAWQVCPLRDDLLFFLPPDWRAFPREDGSLLLFPPEARPDETHRLVLAFPRLPAEDWIQGPEVAERLLVSAPPGWKLSSDQLLRESPAAIREVVVGAPDGERSALLLRVEVSGVGVDLFVRAASSRLAGLREQHRGIARALFRTQ